MTQTDLVRELSARERAVVLAYRTSPETVDQVRASFGLKQHELYAVLRKAREPFRRPASATPMRVARHGLGIATSRLLGLTAPPGAAEPGREGERAEPLSRRLQRILVAQIADLEDRTGPGRATDPGQAARFLAQSVNTYSALLRAEPPGVDEPAPASTEPARDLTALRDELRGHLQRVRDEERARRGLHGDEPHEG